MMYRRKWLVAGFALGAAGLLSGCWERPPIESAQQGYRGTGMVEMTNPRLAEALVEANRIPEDSPPVPAAGPLAKDVFKNLQVLGDLDVGTFTRLMVSVTSWVAPEQGCNYCHAAGDLAADDLYTKVVARRMLQMTRHINGNWKDHVAATGVTCYTCHRGHPVPAYVWSAQPPTSQSTIAGDRYGQNAPAKSVGLTSLPSDPFGPFLVQPGPVRVVADQALPQGQGATIQHTEWSYGLMMHISQALGVNCTYCHNSRSFKEWSQSSPARAIGWYGIRMVRDLNVNYLEPLQSTIPADRRGPLGDVLKLNCATCHQGANKPLKGVSMLGGHPELAAVVAPPAAAPAPRAPSGTLARVLFDVGRAVISADGRADITSAARALLDSPSTKVDVSGFADKTGNATQNLELAKQRALAVRDALRAAGVAEDRISLKKPEFVVGGATADSRRVEINAVN
jgi:photosynthetic reaction center cytochrome c subunit